MVSSVLLTLLAITGSVIAQESTLLYIPGFDIQALSADVVGVGSDGRTTYVLQAPAVQPTDTIFDGADPFPATATLVEGSDYASVGAALDSGVTTISFAAVCTISASVALCSAGNGDESITTTDDVVKFPVQLGTTAALADPTPAPGASSGGSSGTPVVSTGGSSGTGLTTVKSSQSSASSSSAPATSTSSSSTSGASAGWEVSVGFYTVLVALVLANVVHIGSVSQ
ncbi:hypothetical protein BDQ17DRAFT_1540704 [Cyathus striatus]|nr:hypothetical protein BDQ17DRAFT_1540704 [Cyathus striatus]